MEDTRKVSVKKIVLPKSFRGVQSPTTSAFPSLKEKSKFQLPIEISTVVNSLPG
jgi:hypothetical protein